MSATPVRPALLPMGPTAFLLDLSEAPDPLAAVLDWHADLLAHPEPGQVEALAAARTVLMRFVDPASAAAAAPRLPLRTPAAADAGQAREVRVETVYDGEDLAEVARLTGLSTDAVIEAHTGTPWRVAFGGFAPGFFYLAGGDSRLQVPRRDSPRTAVPAGSVALAGEFSAVYPRRSPGGWQLLGRTTAPLWDLDAAPPALLAPGDTVRFVAVREQATLTQAKQEAPDQQHATTAPALTVLDPGLRTLIQDGGRPYRGDLGVTASGTADAPSAAQANRLVGNHPDAPVLETLLGGLTLRAERNVVLALTGGVDEATVTQANGATHPVVPCAAFALYAGETLTLNPPRAGLRGYVGLRGTLEVEPVLGSRSTDTLSGLGPTPLAAGDVLRVAPPEPLGARRQEATPATGAIAVGHPEAPATPLPAPGQTVVLRATPGPRADWFGEEGAAALAAGSWVVGPQSDRVGARLTAAEGGAPLTRSRQGELASEGMVPGAVQVPPDGLPVVFLADHPVTGGYPVIAVVHPADLALAAQLRPGTPVRFQITTQGEPR